MKIKTVLNLLYAVLAVMLVFTVSCTRGSSENRGAVPYTILIGGSTSVTPLIEMFKDEYAQIKPHIKIDISGTGSGDGINNAGLSYQIGMSSRELTPAEKGRGLKEDIVAIDGIAVIVNRNNPVSNLSVEQIRDIYTGVITNWSQVGGRSAPIAVVSREEGSGTRGAFEELTGVQGRLLAGANESTSTGAIKAGIANNPDAIGYISLGSVDDTIKALSVGGVSPSAENVKSGAYRIARPFIVISANDIHPESAAFIEWMLSEEGQAIAGRSWISIR
jgi:phosphate transport system substrate-binding protein